MPDESIIIPIELKPAKGFEDLAKLSNVVSKAVALVESTADQVTGSLNAMGGAATKSASVIINAFTEAGKPLEQLERMLTGLQKLAINPSVNVSQLEALNQLISATELKISVLKATSDIVVRADGSQVRQMTLLIDALEKELLVLQTASITPNISSSEFSAFNQQIEITKAKIAELKASGSILLTANSSQIEKTISTIDLLQKELDGIKTTSVEPKINAAPLLSLNQIIRETAAQTTTSLSGIGNAGNASVKLLQSAFTGVIKPIAQLEAEISELEQAIKRSTNIGDLKRFSDQIGVLSRQINNMKVVGFETSLNAISGASQRAGNALQQLPNSTNRANYALTNLGRIAQDLPYGMIGIANNITPLIESMVALSAQAKATGVSMGKQLLSSLVGGGGLIFGFSILSSVLQFATIGLSAFTRGAGGAGKKAEEIKDEVFSFGKVVDEVAGELAKSASKVTQLFAAINSGRLNFDERKAALKELATVNKEFFGSLKEEDGLIKGLQGAYDGYILRLKEIGKTKAIESQLTKLFDKKLQLELSVDPKFISAIDPLVQTEIGRLKKELASLGGAVDLSKTDFSKTIPEFGTSKVKEFGKVASDSLSVVLKNAEKADAAEKKTQQTLSRRLYLMQRIAEFESTGAIHFVPGVLEGAQQEINNLDLQINALSSLLKRVGVFEIDVPKPNDKDFEKKMDELLARARQFVKEFGDVFVLPDLEETFFHGKKEVLKDALKLFDDIKIGNLKIKLPKIEFVAAEGTVPFEPKIDPDFKFDEDGKLRKMFMDEIFKEFNEPIVIDPTINVAVFNEKIKTQLDKALKSGDFKGALDLIDTDKTNAVFDGLSEEVKTSASLINDTLTPAFQGMFDAIIKGENPLKAFFNSVIQSINQVIQRLISAAIQAAILAAISGGSIKFGDAFGKLFGGGGGAANFGQRVGFAGGGGGVANVSVTGVLRGTDIYLSGVGGGRSIGRAGG